MSTFLELCQDFREDVGIAGSITSTQSQTGMLLRVVNWVSKADSRIQTLWSDWDFLWSEWQLELVTGVDGKFSGPSLIGMFDTDNFWIDAGTEDAEKITYIPYSEYQRKYKYFYFDPDYPDIVTVDPGGKVIVVPEPDSTTSGKILSCDYWRKPVRLANNGDVSLIPTQFHQIIIERAKIFHATFRHDNGALEVASAEYSRLLKNLEAHSLPGRKDEEKSEASEPIVITVE